MKVKIGILKNILIAIFSGIILIGLIKMAFGLHGIFFAIDIAFVLVLASFAFLSIAAIFSFAMWGWYLLLSVLILELADIASIYYFRSKPAYFAIVTFFIGLSLLICIFSMGKKKKIKAKKLEVHEQVANKDFEPGRFVGPATGKTYHVPACNFAKRIRKSNRVWFDSEDEAAKKGYKAHRCNMEKVYKNF